MTSSVAYIVAPLLGFTVAQALKYILQRAKRYSWKDVFRSGSMPSGHSAVVTSLAGTIFLHEGVSPIFAVAVTFALVTIYDALVARRSIGEQGTALLKIIQSSTFAKEPLPRVALGHTPSEVMAGMALGIVISIFVAFFITQ